MTDEEMAKGTVEIDNSCYHCYTGAIGECFGIDCVFIAPMSYIAWCEIPKFEEE